MSVYQHKSKETKVTLLLRDPRTFVSPWSVYQRRGQWRFAAINQNQQCRVQTVDEQKFNKKRINQICEY